MSSATTHLHSTCISTLGLFCVLLLSLPGTLSMVLAAEIDFNRDVRPILSDKCYACHGPDESQRQAGLRLDTMEGAFADLGGYAAVVEGDPQSSELVKRIHEKDTDLQMPPPEANKSLSDAERATLVEWIRQGASWSEHWSYVPPRRVTPQAADCNLFSGWPGGFVDAFVAAKLAEHQLSPSPPAKPSVLMRRLYFDLTGLPPSNEEVQAFESDPSEVAYERIVDRLLSSPHFGERMAVYWLDLVRYADTVGYHGDQDVSVSPYRDYVIQAFNSNLPFDQFTREQLAGDLLPDPTKEQLVASGYNKLGMMSAEGGVQPEEYLAKYIADRVRNAGSVWMASTVGCAECHDHKFDPFSTKDFYQFAAFFADIKERGLYSGANADGNWGPTVEVQDVALQHLREPIKLRQQQLQAELNAESDQLDAEQKAWEEQQAAVLRQWKPITVDRASAENEKTQLGVLEDGSILAQGETAKQDCYELQFELPESGATALRLDALPHADLPEQGPGRAKNGNFVLTEIELLRLDAPDSAEATEVSLVAATATFEQAAEKGSPHGKWSAAATVDGDKQDADWGWAILPEVAKQNSLVVQFNSPLPAGSYKLLMQQQHSNPQHLLGHFKWLFTCQPRPVTATDLPTYSRALQEAIVADDADRSDEQRQLIRQHFRSITPRLADVREELAELQKRDEELVAEHTRTTLVTVSVEPREIRVLRRGNWMDKSGEVVQPSAPHFLEPIAKEQGRASRLDLANWLVSPGNPLTARTFVNRLWKHFWGAGLSKTLDDLGSQGEPPSHPELLDTLAVEFVESGWDVKQLVRRMVLSNTYRQSSMPRPELKNLDPYNRLLARQARYRFEAELVRDNALAISGLLVRNIGGRSAKPYQPAGLYRHLNFPPREYEHDVGADQYRRGLYTHWQRQFLHPAMQTFDAPAREECTAERPRSNTPLAALVLLNDPSYVEAARRLSELSLQVESIDDDARVRWLMLRALCREPQAAELAVLLELVQQQREYFAAHREAAQKLVETGLSPRLEEQEVAELAAWTSVCRAILNMHEVITRY
ncbi:MAG: PSD1 and planctomycete cytochrome C domain-containing protein [bacterium]|nr:PSD1 and planctomycete cytochrome C domain-containing protein [bacterium]